MFRKMKGNIRFILMGTQITRIELILTDCFFIKYKNQRKSAQSVLSAFP